jgi:hypothetical protein
MQATPALAELAEACALAGQAMTGAGTSTRSA